MKGVLIRNLTVGLAAVAIVCGAAAQPIGYARTLVKIRCGILLLESTAAFWGAGVPTNADPYVFFNLDRRTDLKPPAWEFDNPLASGSITPQMEARWDAIFGGAGLGPFTTGDKLFKNMAPYWEVDLNQISEEKITEYDILLIHAPGGINLNPLERSKLHAFTDSGGILWFDKSTLQSVEAFNGFPVPFRVTSAGANPQVLQSLHPILTYPYRIGGFRAAFMGSHRGRHAIQRESLGAIGLGGYEAIISTMAPDFDRINVVISNSAGVVLGIAPLGNGFMVLTSSNIVSRINEPAGGTALGGLGRNSGPVAGEDFLNIPPTELKFAYNMIALAGGHPALSKGGRRLNSSFDHIGAPLLQSWVDPAINLSQGDHTNYVPPAIYKGLVFVTSGSNLYAYKTDPNRDLDGDGLTDDGLQDSSIGATRDLVWVSTDMPTPLSSPVGVEVSNAGSGVPTDQIYVVDGGGDLRVFDAFPRDAGGRLFGPAPIAPVAVITDPGDIAVVDPGLVNRGPYAPVFMEGLVYIYDTYVAGFGERSGRVWVVDAATLLLAETGGTPWSASGTGSPNLPEPGGAPTIGYIPTDDNPGGLDKVIYVSNRSRLARSSAGISSIWVGVRNESPTVTRTPTNIDLTTRAAAKGLRVFLPLGESSYGVRVYLVDDNGVPLDPPTTATYLDGSIVQFSPGRLRLGLNSPLPTTIGVKIDYHIDWGTGEVNLIAKLIRGQLFLPDDVQRRRYMQKSLALAPNGNLFIVTSNEINNGVLFSVREFARGQFRLNYRWDLHDGFTLVLNNTETVRLPPVLENRDDMYPIFGMPFPRLTRLHFHGNPVVRNNVVYVTAHADHQFGFFFPVPATYLLAFDADREPAEIRLSSPLPAGLRVRQPDIAASSNRSRPERFVTLQRRQAEQIRERGLIRFNNMMSSISGQMRNAFSTSMPVIISGNGVSEMLLDPETTGSRWNPLLWYFCIPSFRNESPPMVMGGTVYAAGASMLDSFLRGLPPSLQGALFAMDSEIPPNDPSLITIPGQPGLRQSRWVIADPSQPTGFRTNPHVRWPSGEGVSSLNDFLVRLSQTLLEFTPQALGVIGGDGTLVTWGDIGLYAYNRAATIVADEGRIVELDSAGFALWSSDLTYQYAQNGGTTLVQTRKLERPTKAYKIAENEYAVVDTGGNRIVRIDKSAGEVRTLERVLLDATFRPSGWSEGDPIELRQPRDVAVWTDFVPAANNVLPTARSLEFWVHYLIADTGNRRMIELVDRYVAVFNTATRSYEVGDVVIDGGQAQLGVLIWHTPANLSGKTWQYTSIRRFQIGIDPASGNAQFVFVGGIGDMMPTRVNTGLDPPSGAGQRETGGGNGGLVIFDPVNGDQVINEVLLPTGVTKKLFGVNSVMVRPVGLNGNFIEYAILFTDSQGVFEVRDIGGIWTVIWMLPNGVYESVRGVKLRAVSAERMLNGQVLITNSFYGTDNSGNRFMGEVTQWRDDYNPVLPDLGFTALSIQFELPPVVGTRGLRIPQFAGRR
ncbi:MAG: hypothetical protein IH851_08810 [Armatimonadetes bacterium]|nr:hypothetical protein [Armatimonadota bacterium]